MAVRKYLKVEGRLQQIVFEDLKCIKLENGQTVPINLVGQYEYIEMDQEPERRHSKRQQQYSLI
ncbi:hypothetical protein [Maridesulfovibrio sp.]|uniref:hypothetical protein n=1 Tax=Maridesulfovibrio sp. TaxID=2795000 RepID=UPI0029CA2CA8|nr:hypothetical protein [Maridesulfovibrio sp.]